MSIKENLKETIKILPESVRRSLRFCLSPGIVDNNVEDNRVLRNFLEIALMTGVVIALLKAALPNTFKIDMVNIINPFILTVILIFNGIIFSIIFYGLSRGVLAFKDNSGLKLTLLYQPMKLFAIYNILLSILMMIGVNRIVTNSSLNKPTSEFDLWLGVIVALVVFWLAVRTLIKPVATYFRNYFNKTRAMALAVLTTVSASVFNPALGFAYFDRLIDKRKICEYRVEEHYESGLIAGTVNFHQKLLECLRNVESARGR